MQEDEEVDLGDLQCRKEEEERCAIELRGYAFENWHHAEGFHGMKESADRCFCVGFHLGSIRNVEAY